VSAAIDTGFHEFHIETPAGSSQKSSLFVRSRPNPRIDGLFPNYGSAGSQNEVTIAGDEFYVGARVQPASPILELPRPVRVMDRRILTTRFRIGLNPRRCCR